MGAIVPAILPKSNAELSDKLGRLSGLASDVQIDVIDGRYASPASWPYAMGSVATDEPLPYLGSFNFELDLMVEDPGRVMGGWVDHGASRLTIHAESARDLPGLLNRLQVEYGHDKGFAPGLLSVGLAIGIETDLALLEPHLPHADYVQFMGIRTIGRQGEPFDNRIVRKIVAFRQEHPETPVQVDGGVNLSTAPILLDAGVSRLVIGSGLWKAPDLEVEMNKYLALAQEYGIYER